MPKPDYALVLLPETESSSIVDVGAAATVQSPISSLQHTRPPPTFHPFRRLPPELRIAIWKYSLPDARLIPVIYRASVQRYIHYVPIPALMHTTRESRAEAKRVYHELTLGDVTSRVKPGCYVDFSKDLVFLSAEFQGMRPILENFKYFYNKIWERHGLCVVSPDFREMCVRLYLKTAAWSSSVWWNFRPSFSAWHSVARNITYHLLTSRDGQRLLRNLVVNFETWEMIRSKLYSLRQPLKMFPLRSLNILVERDDGSPVVAPRLLKPRYCRRADFPKELKCHEPLHQLLALEKYDMNSYFRIIGRTEKLKHRVSVIFLW